MRSGWQLAGSGPEAYERYLAGPILGPAAERLLEAAGVGSGDRVLDLACGTGVVARLAVGRVGPEGEVTGADLNPGMVAVARSLPEGADVDWHEADAAALPFEDERFDAVVCQQAFQFFPDRPAALAETRRVLAPDGRMAFSVLRGIDRNPFQKAVAEAMSRHVGPEAGAVIHTPFALADADVLRDLAEDAGFRDVHVRIEFSVIRHASLDELVPGVLAATPAAPAVAGADGATRAALLEDLHDALASYLDDDGVAAPVEYHLLTARR